MTSECVDCTDNPYNPIYPHYSPTTTSPDSPSRGSRGEGIRHRLENPAEAGKYDVRQTCCWDWDCCQGDLIVDKNTATTI